MACEQLAENETCDNSTTQEVLKSIQQVLQHMHLANINVHFNPSNLTLRFGVKVHHCHSIEEALQTLNAAMRFYGDMGLPPW